MANPNVEVIGHFPTPYPDELFFSIVARYSEKVRYTNKEFINLELFGSRGVSVGIDLPGHLNYLTSHLPSNHYLTTDRTIAEHTLLPYYSPFLPERKVEQIRAYMGSNINEAHKYAGTQAASIQPPMWLRFCPLCVDDDKSEYQECYWHRLHQVPGVEVCPRHSVFLENSSVRARNRVYSAEYLSAEEVELLARPRFLLDSKPDHHILLDIAKDISWLLDQTGLNPGYSRLFDAYMNLLIVNNLIVKGKGIRKSKLLELVNVNFSQPLLNTLQCGLNAQKKCHWPFIIIHNLKIEKVHHPIRHLLFIRLLGQDAKSFFTDFMRIVHSSDEQVADSASFDRKQEPSKKIIHSEPNIETEVTLSRRGRLEAERKRVSYRETLLLTLATYPQAARTELRKELIPREYKWLLINDKEWLTKHLPEKKKRVGPFRQVNWSVRDAHISAAIRRESRRIKNTLMPPLQVTFARIARALNLLPLLSKKESLTKLPETNKVLAEVVETNLEFYFRKLNWAVKGFALEGIVPTYTRLARKASIPHRARHIPEVRAALESALDSLSKHNQLETQAA